MRKSLATTFVVGAIAITTVLSGCSADAPGTAPAASGGNAADGAGMTIGISLDNLTAFREGEKKFLDSNASEMGVTLIYQVAQLDAQTQSTQIQTLISQGSKAIIAIPSDIQAIKTDIDSSVAAGVPVVTLDQAPAETSWVPYHVGGDPYADGLAAGKQFVTIANGQPFKLLELQGALNNDNGIRRSKGLHDGIASASNITIVASVPTDWKPEPALTGIQNALQQYSDLGGIFLPTDGQIPPALSALTAANRLQKVGTAGHVAIVSIDGDSNGCQGVRDNYVDMDIATPIPEMTKRALQQAVASANGTLANTADFLPGTPYTNADVEQKASLVWGCS